MKKNILATSITIIFIDLIITFAERSYIIRGLVPFYSILVHRYFTIKAYDVFLVIGFLILRIIYAHNGINFKTLASLRYLFYPRDIKDIAFMAVAAIITHFYLFTWLTQILSDPIKAIILAPDAIKKSVIVILPFIWLLALTVISRCIATGISRNTQPMPSTW
ncbi:MAG: hypothetical protein AB1611_12835 [bacterium]